MKQKYLPPSGIVAIRLMPFYLALALLFLGGGGFRRRFGEDPFGNGQFGFDDLADFVSVPNIVGVLVISMIPLIYCQLDEAGKNVRKNPGVFRGERAIELMFGILWIGAGVFALAVFL